MNINLVNFFPISRSPNYVNASKKIFLINVGHNTSCTEFTIRLPSKRYYIKYIKVVKRK